MTNIVWHPAEQEMPKPLETPMDRCTENALLIYTPVDGMVRVGWYLGLDYRNHHKWITANANYSYQVCQKRVTYWTPVPIPNDGIVECQSKNVFV